MERTRLTVREQGDYQVHKLDPETCLFDVESTYHADVDGDGMSDRIVVRERSRFVVPRVQDQYQEVEFIRESSITVDIYESGAGFIASFNPQSTEVRFRDIYPMTMDKFNNSASCPMPSYRGLSLVEDQGQRYLELGVGFYTMVGYSSEGSVQLIRHINKS